MPNLYFYVCYQCLNADCAAQAGTTGWYFATDRQGNKRRFLATQTSTGYTYSATLTNGTYTGVIDHGNTYLHNPDDYSNSEQAAWISQIYSGEVIAAQAAAEGATATIAFLLDQYSDAQALFAAHCGNEIDDGYDELCALSADYPSTQIAQATGWYVISNYPDRLRCRLVLLGENPSSIPDDSGSGGGGGGGTSGGGTSGGGTSGGGTSGGDTSGGGTSGGGTSGGGTSGGGTSGGGTSGGETPDINIPAGYTLWLKGGKLVVTVDNKPILCDSCPCTSATCFAVFRVVFNMPGPPTRVDDTAWYPVNLTPGDQAITRVTEVLCTLPAGSTITNVAVTYSYTHTYTEHFFTTPTATSSIVNSSVSLIFTNILKAFYLAPDGAITANVVVAYVPATENTNCNISTVRDTITAGSYFSPVAAIRSTDPYTQGRYYCMTVDNKYGWGGSNEAWQPELYAVPATAGTAPAENTPAYHMIRTPDPDPWVLGPYRSQWYVAWAPIAYNELNGNAGVYRLDGNFTVSCGTPGYSGLYNVFIYRHLDQTAFVATRYPSVGDTVYANWGEPGDIHRFESVGTVESTWSFLEWFHSGSVYEVADDCRLCGTTRGGIQTVPEEFE